MSLSPVMRSSPSGGTHLLDFLGETSSKNVASISSRFFLRQDKENYEDCRQIASTKGVSIPKANIAHDAVCEESSEEVKIQFEALLRAIASEQSLSG